MLDDAFGYNSTQNFVNSRVGFNKMKHILEGNHLGFFKFIIHIFIFCNNHVRVLLRKYH